MQLHPVVQHLPRVCWMLGKGDKQGEDNMFLSTTLETHSLTRQDNAAPGMESMS